MKRLTLSFTVTMILGLLATQTTVAQKTKTSDQALTPVTVKTDLYPADADANKEISDALEKATAGNKRVILIFGGNWCYDCHVLDQALHEGDAGKIARESFLLVHVDIGEGNKNLDLVERYKTTLDKGVPTVVILDADGKVIYSSTNGEFEPARSMLKKDLVAFLKKWKPTAVARPTGRATMRSQI